MRILELARATGLTVDTIRFYEKVGLINPPARLPNGYRDYPPSTVACLRLCAHARSLGFTLKELVELGRLFDDRKLSRAKVRARLAAKQREIDERIAALSRLRADLTRALKNPDRFVTAA